MEVIIGHWNHKLSPTAKFDSDSTAHIMEKILYCYITSNNFLVHVLNK